MPLYTSGWNLKKMAIIGTQITIDKNGRFVVPSDKRRIFDESKNIIVVLDDADEIRRRVLIYSGKSHLAHLNHLRNLASKGFITKSGEKLTKAESLRIVSMYEENAIVRRIDPSGRMSLPLEILGLAGIKDIAYIGGVQRIALYSPPIWKQLVEEREHLLKSLSYEQRVELAEIPFEGHVE